MTDLLSHFDEFWSAYPRKVGKGQARKAYARALKVVTHDEIMIGLSDQRAIMDATETQFIPHASTWLNGERWTDDIASIRPQNTVTHARDKQAVIAAGFNRSPGRDCF